MLLLVLAGTYTISGCQNSTGPSATTEATLEPVQSSAVRIAEAVVLPIRQVNLSFTSAGIVDEILIQEGQPVKTGDVIARLKGSEKMNAAIVGAELEVLSAQQAIEDLNENAVVAAAQVQLELALKQKDLDDAQKKFNALSYKRATTANLEEAQSRFTLAEKAYEQAKKIFDNLKDRPTNNPERAQAALFLAEKQKAKEQAEAELNWLLGFPTDLEIGERQAKLALSKAEVDRLTKRYEILKNGPDPDELAIAQARLKNAEATLRSAKEALDDLLLVSSIDGVLVTSNIDVGEFVSPGTNQIIVADLSQWQIETTDLIELQVVGIQEGDPVTITFDALPGTELSGKVVRIKPIGENRQGDITYTVVIALDKQDNRLRWNMTAVVNFVP